MSSKTKETNQKVLFEIPCLFLDPAIQTISIETQGSLEIDFKFIATNLFPNVNQIVSEVFTTDSNLPIHFENSLGQFLPINWNKDNTTTQKDVVEYSQASSSHNTSSTSTIEDFCEKKDEATLKKTLLRTKGKKPPPYPPPLFHNPTSSMPAPMVAPRVLNVAPYLLFHGHLGTDPNRHVDRFVVVAHANQLPENIYILLHSQVL